MHCKNWSCWSFSVGNLTALGLCIAEKHLVLLTHSSHPVNKDRCIKMSLFFSVVTLVQK